MASLRVPLHRPPASLCILRSSALGDVTHMAAVVRSIQRAWPETAITWIVGRAEYALVGDIAGVEFIILDKGLGWRGYYDLAQRLRGRWFDVLLHNQVALRANVASLFIRAGVRLGYDPARSKDLHGLFVNARVPPTPRQHVLDAYFSFAETLGVPRGDTRWDLPVPEADRAFARRVIPADVPTLIISPASSHTRRNWHAEGYARVAESAVRQHGLRVMVTGGPSDLERQLAATIRAGAVVPVEDWVGRTTIKQMLALLERATLVVSPDSGPAHMANAVGTPVLGLYACTNPGRAAPYDSPQWCVDRYDAAARQFLQWPAEGLKWGTKIEYPGVMNLIRPEDVMERLDAFMAAGAPRAHDGVSRRASPPSSRTGA